MSDGYMLSGSLMVRRRPKNGVGVSITSSTIRYAEGNSGTQRPQSGWQASVPSVSNGNYLWTWVRIVYSDGTETNSYSVSRIGIDGKGIKSSVVKYCEKSSTATPPQSFPESDWGDFPANLTDGNWLYSRTKVTYSDDSVAVSYDVYQIGQGSYYAGLQEYYTVTDTAAMPEDYPGKLPADPQFVDGVAVYPNGQTPRISNIWKNSIAQASPSSAHPYLWNFEVSRDSKGNKYVTEPRPVGNFSKGVTSIVEAYAISAYSTKSGDNPPPDIQGWTDEAHAAAPTAAKPYQWNRTTTTYNDNSVSINYHVSSVRGTDGQNGRDGVDGQNGRDGVDGQNGRDGIDGQDGQDGRDGIDGQDGQDGNGIATDDFYYKLTDTPFPPSTTSLTVANGWYISGSQGCPVAPDDVNPYLWQCEWIQYTRNTGLNKKVLKLSQVYNMLPQPNLLEDTAFDSEDRLTHWEVHNGTITPDARQDSNGFALYPAAGNYTEGLLQRIYRPGFFSKIKPSTWYTLSFYSRTRIYVNATSSAYGFPSTPPGAYQFTLKPGRYRLVINGHCSAAARQAAQPVSLRGYLFGPASVGTGWKYSIYTEITSLNDETAQSGIFTIPSGYDGEYKVWFYAFKAQGQGGDAGELVTINWFQILDLDNNGHMCTYIYSSPSTQPLEPDTKFIVDGKVREHSPTDGVVNWYLDQDTNPDANGWTRHSVAYKTKASIPEVIQNLLFRTFNSYVEICQPKFEECIMPTEWMRHENDAKMTFSRNPAGTWVPGRVYYYFDGIQDWVYARRGENDATKIVYVMRKRTTALGYESNTEPYLDPVHWEPSSYQRFICSESMFAEEIFSDFIKSKKLLTEGDDTKVSIADGLLQFFGKSNGSWLSNIRLGLVDGSAALMFYDNAGNVVATLGPGGLKLRSVAGDAALSVELLPGLEWPLKIGQNYRVKRDGSVEMLAGTFSGDLVSAGGIFRGGLRAPYKFKQDNYTLSLPDDSCILAYNISGTITITVPAITRDSSTYNGLEVRIARFYYGSATVNVRINGTVMNQHSDTRNTDGRTVSLGKGKEVVLRAVLFSYAGQASGYWLLVNSRDFA